jgi:hypothetical protein
MRISKANKYLPEQCISQNGPVARMKPAFVLFVSIVDDKFTVSWAADGLIITLLPYPKLYLLHAITVEH